LRVDLRKEKFYYNFLGGFVPKTPLGEGNYQTFQLTLDGNGRFPPVINLRGIKKNYFLKVEIAP
jgi:hypothetical protein